MECGFVIGVGSVRDRGTGKICGRRRAGIMAAPVVVKRGGRDGT